MKKIGITAGLKLSKNSAFEKYDLSLVSDNYVKSITNVGAAPVILPVIEDDDIMTAQLEGLDGLVLTGGDDIYPDFYNEEMLEGCGEAVIERDLYEIKLTKKALELKIPIFGICRGLQVINVALGGTLYQDLQYIDGIRVKHVNKNQQQLKSHKAIINEGSFLGRIYNDEVWVNSFHHQAVKELGKGLKVSAMSSDGIIEAIEGVIDDTPIYAVQWHPEMLASKHDEDMIKLFDLFIKS